ncbi:MAG: hypothetical protein Kow0090_00120 [Myxococcota bacterium]
MRFVAMFAFFAPALFLLSCESGYDCRDDTFDDNFTLTLCGDPYNCNLIRSGCDMEANCTNTMKLVFSIPAEGEEGEVEFVTGGDCRAIVAHTGKRVTLEGSCAVSGQECGLFGEFGRD